MRLSPDAHRGRAAAGVRALLSLFLAIAAIPGAIAQPAALAIYCSHDSDACELAGQMFQRETGIVTRITRKPTGETYAQIRAERANPKGDVWYGGTIEPFIQAAAEGLFSPHRSPQLAELHPWAVREAERTGYRVTAIYRLVIAFGSNPALLARKSLPSPRCWSDLTDPRFRAEIELSNPVTSGTGYTILATLITLYGEDEAFDYLRRLAPNVVRYTQSGTAQGPSVARGEVGVGVSFAHEFVTQRLAGFDVDITIPCEGTGSALGGMALIAGGPNPDGARRFLDWALTRPAQEIANRTRNLIIPANATADVRPEAATFATAPAREMDIARFGAPEERRRLLGRWQREIGDRR